MSAAQIVVQASRIDSVKRFEEAMNEFEPPMTMHRVGTEGLGPVEISIV